MIANFLINDYITILNRNKMDPSLCAITSSQLAKIVDLLQQNRLNTHYARAVLQELVDRKDEEASQICPEAIVRSNNWFLITEESQIQQYLRQAIDANPQLVEKYRKGKVKMLYALAGEVAKASEQKIDMARAVELLQKMLKSG